MLGLPVHCAPGRAIKYGDVMPGLGKVSSHGVPHRAEPDKGHPLV